MLEISWGSSVGASFVVAEGLNDPLIIMRTMFGSLRRVLSNVVLLKRISKNSFIEYFGFIKILPSYCFPSTAQILFHPHDYDLIIYVTVD